MRIIPINNRQTNFGSYYPLTEEEIYTFLANNHDFLRFQDQDAINVLFEEKTKLQNDYSNSKSETYIINQKQLEAVVTPYQEKLNEIGNERLKLNVEIQSLELEISRLNSIKDICPTCGQKLPGVEKPSTEKQTNQLKQLELKLSDVNFSFQSINANHLLTIKDLM